MLSFLCNFDGNNHPTALTMLGAFPHPRFILHEKDQISSKSLIADKNQTSSTKPWIKLRESDRVVASTVSNDKIAYKEG